MPHLLSRLLVTFALGFIATGVLVGFMPAGSGGCGAPFSGGSGYTDQCSDIRADRRALPVALIGIGATTLAAAMVAYSADEAARRSRARPSAPAAPESDPA
jgi:hypothetical protein